MQQDSSFRSALAVREQYRDDYWRKHDPIAEDRLLWRAQTFRHMVHLLPGQTILELGCGQGFFTRALLRASREENPITAVTFQRDARTASDVEAKIELLEISDIPGSLSGRRFDYVVAMDLLDRSYGSRFFAAVKELLAPGGEVVAYESNPGNPILRLRRLLLRLLRKPDPRHLLRRSQIYDLISAVGFISVYAVYNDFVFPPLTRRLIWLLRNRECARCSENGWFNPCPCSETTRRKACARHATLYAQIIAAGSLLCDSVPQRRDEYPPFGRSDPRSIRRLRARDYTRQ